MLSVSTNDRINPVEFFFSYNENEEFGNLHQLLGQLLVLALCIHR